MRRDLCGCFGAMKPNSDEYITALYRAAASGSGIGAASCDLAERIWNGDVDDETLLCLLNHPDSVVRREVSWAVADAIRPVAGICWLFEKGFHDREPIVRYWALRAVLEWDEEVPSGVKSKVRSIAENDCEELRRLAQAIADKWSGDNVVQ